MIRIDIRRAWESDIETHATTIQLSTRSSALDHHHQTSHLAYE